MMNFLRRILALFAICAAAHADEPRFNKDILPIFADHCFKCHGADGGAREADLRLDDEDVAKNALPSGVTPIVPGQQDASAIYQRITSTGSDRMPPPDEEGPLTDEQVRAIAEWIENGATWESHWAYIAPVKRDPPPVSDAAWPRNPIDSFVLAKLESMGMQPAIEADRRTLLRRLHLDLTGLPPTPEELSRFLEDTSPDAYADAVDGLLTSPHFGEKWARWWLDLAGYADSDGYLSDFLRPWAWRYRQWVIDAINDDMPFDEFTLQQIAGDLLPNATTSQRIATGFFRNTTSNREGGADLEEFRTHQTVDRTKMLGTAWLAATLECAQCHDHKYDPITQREFYKLYAFFNDADEVNIDAPRGDEAIAYEGAWPVYLAARDALIAPIAGEIAALQAQWEEQLLWAAAHPGEGDYRWDRAYEVLGLIWGQNYGEGQLEGTVILRKPVEERTDDERLRLQDYFFDRGSMADEAKFAELGISEIAKKIGELRDKLPPMSRAPTLRATYTPRQTHIHIRGDFRAPGDPVERGTPAVLHEFDAEVKPSRLDLAEWIVDSKNPLTSRVVVNRFWQEIFGRGIVYTSGDFGIRGARPTHPDLLDWMAVQFIEDGWSMKAAIRRIVMSATYRQSSSVDADRRHRDPANIYLARHARTRLSAELVRDSALAVSGLLNPTIGGPSVRPPQPESVTSEGFDNTWVASDGADRYRRGIYTFIQRTSPFGQFVNFDFPDVNRTCTRRERSNTPLQALNLLNDPTFFQAAQALAAQVLSEGGSSISERIDYAYICCVGRTATGEERDRLTRLYDSERERLDGDADRIAAITGEWAESLPGSEGAAWVIVCSAILNLDEFITKE